ncbi:MAG: PAS domain S-box protein [Chlorobi bacterium]|nr:PAS domain S-box protein [Chlorobiota bacterium]
MSKILIVDDKKDNVTAISAILKMERPHIDIITAYSGQDGIMKAQHEAPDVVVLDIHMPGMDGFEVCTRLKTDDSTKHIPILFLTARRTSPRDRVKGLELGGDAFLTKPVDQGELIAQISVLLRMKQAEDALRDENIHLAQRIAERTRTLEESEERYRSLIHTASDAIICADEKSVITVWNNAAVKMFGYETEEAIGKKLHDLIVPKRFHNQSWFGLDQFRKSDTGADFGRTLEVIGRRKNGEEFPIELSVSKYHSGDSLHVTGILRDLTERKALEEELVSAKEKAERADKLKDAFIANVSHEVRTPLNIILGFTDLIQTQFGDLLPPSVDEYFTSIQDSGQRLMKTVDSILNIARFEAGDFKISPKEFNLSDFLSRMVNEYKHLAENKRLDLAFINECGNVSILADSYCFSQALGNLLDNAIKFTLQGSVHVHLYFDQKANPCIDVKDTGIGISGEYMKRIYEPYTQEEFGYSRPFEGIGLGLALVKRYLDLHGASISVNSRKGAGTTFTIKDLPVTMNAGKNQQLPHSETMANGEIL